LVAAKGKRKHFGNAVADELKAMLDPKYTSAEIFSGLGPDPSNETARRIAGVDDATIRNLVDRYLGENAAFGRDGLADRLIARRNDLADKYGLSR
jgi:hypothetical protein